MRICLHYGEGEVRVDIPEENLQDVIRPWSAGGEGNCLAMAERMLGRVEGENFSESVAGRNVCVLIADGTRDFPLDDVLPGLVHLLMGAERVSFGIATGTHDADTEANGRIIEQIRRIAEREGLVHYDIFVHDCEGAEFAELGVTSRGTPVRVNEKVLGADVYVVLSDVKPHYFGGYSNPVKYFLPGMCAYETVEKNHALALDELSTFCVHPWCGDEGRRGNPLARDQLEGMEMIVGGREVWAVAIVSSGGKALWGEFGLAEEVSREAFEVSDERNVREVGKADRLIVSPGGLPNDVDLYISQRALELTGQAVRDGGEVLFVSACPGGVGAERTRANFYDRLTQPLEDVLASIDEEYVLFAHKPYKFAQMIRRLRKLWVYSEMDDETIRRAHMEPAGDVQKVVDEWIRQEPGCRITVVDGANKLALRAVED
ncbi:hypothetical protein STSP2_03208 [Anaerohalosphaera lusitana]|uniref:Uncharacterized protein n=1 Tax=Anaerohalosphaera lusitana TaxID=1936003 RepID=A0A1U9NQF2_9BACT|nr:lactate racemase domain-containing protein [Anaerohalosphaera lusitana]AQT70007.1 hypothetical protein STSP2_03208 [Anaerohalosphaera lusitana]